LTANLTKINKLIVCLFLTDIRQPIDRQLSEIPMRKGGLSLPNDIVRINFD